MSSANQFAAELVRQGSSAYGGLAARALLEAHPELAEGMGRSPFLTWKDSFEQRLVELATALEEQQPETFVAQVQWVQTTWEARELAAEALPASLTILQSVLAEELPPAAGKDPAHYLKEALRALENGKASQEPRFLNGDSEQNRLGAAFLEQLFHGNAPAAEELVVDAIEQGTLTVEDALRTVLTPSLREIGLMWQLGEATVPDEHFATSVTRRLASRLTAGLRPASANGKTLLAASLSTEAHDFGLQLVSERFFLDGWRVVNLGASVPPNDVLAAAEQHSADIVAISATLATHRSAVAGLIQESKRSTPADRQLKFLVGGLAFADDSSWKKMGADGTARSAQDAVRIARELVGLEPR